MRQDDELDLPRELRDELKAIYGSARGMENRDGAILDAARDAGEHAAASRRRVWWLATAGMAAAAVVAVAVLLPSLGKTRQSAKSHPAQSEIPLQANVSYVRTGDIRDAFYLERLLKARGGQLDREALDGQWDVNGDGVVDERDVQALGAMAVKLPPGQARTEGMVLELAQIKGVMP